MPKSYREARKPQRRLWHKRLALWGALVVLLFILGLVIGYLKTTEPSRTEPVVLDTAEQPTREVILYFASADGQALIAENRSIEECPTDDDCLRNTVESLIAGPQSDLVPILPDQVVLRGVHSADSLVNVDFSQELVSAHPGGTQSELLTIYGLTNTLSVNFPHLRQVRILVEGAPVATLKGHIDLRQPVNPDFSLVQEGMSPTGKMISLPVGGEE